ncbi:MAG: hypothetical protein O3A31_04725 [Planctomycetota bacterium]|nr:hypothetical protein [Planctomycetota bacterium]
MPNEPEPSIVRIMAPSGGPISDIWSDAREVAAAVFASARPERLLLGWCCLVLALIVGSLWDVTSPTNMPALGATEPGDSLTVLFREYVEEFERPNAWDTADVDGREVQRAFASAPEDVRQQVERLRRRGAFESLLGGMSAGLDEVRLGVVGLQPARIIRGLDIAILSNIESLWRNDRGFLVIFGTVFLLLFSIFGGAITRIDAERFSRDRDVPALAVVRWALRDWRRLFGGVFLPPVLALLLLLPATASGLIAYIPGLDVLVSLLWILVLVFSFAAALVIVAWLVALPMLSAGTACESGDPTELVVRCAGLIRHRPGRYVLLLATAVVAGAVGWLLVSGVTVITLEAARAAGSQFGGPFAEIQGTAWPSLDAVNSVQTANESSNTRGLATSILDGWRWLVTTMCMGWTIAFIAGAGGRIYLLQRRSVERLQIDELGAPGPADG